MVYRIEFKSNRHCEVFANRKEVEKYLKQLKKNSKKELEDIADIRKVKNTLSSETVLHTFSWYVF